MARADECIIAGIYRADGQHIDDLKLSPTELGDGVRRLSRAHSYRLACYVRALRHSPAASDIDTGYRIVDHAGMRWVPFRVTYGTAPSTMPPWELICAGPVEDTERSVA